MEPISINGVEYAPVASRPEGTRAVMEFTGAELDILYALTRQESDQLDKKYGFKTHPQKGSYWDLVQKLDRKLSKIKVLRRF
ncbi:MAG: hypothetical protein EBR05_11410 [Marivivens sp.]|nr:hypothetical protein [Marivivens sp.]